MVLLKVIPVSLSPVLEWHLYVRWKMRISWAVILKLRIKKGWKENLFHRMISVYVAQSIFIHCTFLFKANLVELYFEIFIQLNK